MILYFSAMGNSQFVAKKTAHFLNEEMICLNQRIKNANYDPIYSEKPYILVCPIYAWRIPKIVEDYLKKVNLLGNKNVYVLVTTCGNSGNAGKYAEEIFTNKKMVYKGSVTFHMMGSYVAFMENPEPAKEKEVNSRVERELVEILPYLKKLEPLPTSKKNMVEKFMSKVANPIFYRFIIGKDGFYVTDKCIGCGKCVSVCPLNNIIMKDSKPQWENHCTHCMACIHQCPMAAIEFKKITINKNRYYNKGA